MIKWPVDVPEFDQEEFEKMCRFAHIPPILTLFERSWAKMQKKIKIDINHLEESLKNLDNPDLTTLGLALIDRIKFMEKTLVECEKEINKTGVVVEMCQGKYNIDRANPAISAYNSTYKNYESAIKQVKEILQTNQNSSEDLDDFLDTLS